MPVAVDVPITQPDHKQIHRRQTLLSLVTDAKRALGKEKNEENIPNLYDYKMERYFNYPVLPADKAPCGTVGILGVLNIYETIPSGIHFSRSWDII